LAIDGQKTDQPTVRVRQRKQLFIYIILPRPYSQ